MALRVYNTLSRTKEPLEPVNPGEIRMYLCGPTVYKPPHIGHMVGPVIFDAIKRYLQFRGFKVTWVVNITDVDDKLIDAAAEQGTSVSALAEKYTAEYRQCLAAFGVDTIDRFPKASEHMREIIALTQSLIDQGYAYAADGNVWFDVGRDADYGKLSHRRPEEQESGTRTLEGAGKRSPADFALWKAAKPGEPMWDSPWGKGRPGWHIECSAMSMKYLGPTFDLHGGGMDLMFPHHENELAQSESATGKPFAKYWLHNGLTRVNTKKISGSDARTDEGKALLAGLAAKKLLADYGPELLRYMLLATHYRSPIDFSEEVLSASRKGMATFQRLFERIERLSGSPLFAPPARPEDAAKEVGPNFASLSQELATQQARFIDLMDDDFNTAGAIATLHELAGAINGLLEEQKVEATKDPEAITAAVAATQTLRSLGGLLGLFQNTGGTKDQSQDAAFVEGLMQLFIQLRADARKTKNFALADGVRNGLAKLGVTLEDRADGTIWRKE